jgi:hypothetical protein
VGRVATGLSGSPDGGLIPASADLITPEWLTPALQERHPGVRVSAVEVVRRREVTNAHAKLAISYQSGSGPAGPGTVFCKMAPNDPARRQSIIDTGMGRREALFYRSLADRIPLRVPEVHLARVDGEGEFVLLLEDIDATGCRVSDGTWSIDPDSAAAALDDLAGLHLRFADPERRRTEAGWVEPSRPSTTYASTTLRYGLDHHRDRLSDQFAALAELYLERKQWLHDLWQIGPRTIVHGDTHIGNLFVDGTRVGFLDWGMVSVTTPMRDASYFITMALSVEDRRRHERDLLRHYLAAWNAGGEPISFDQAWQTHRLHTAYCVPACCQIVTFPADATPQRQVFAAAFLARAEAAIQDLDPLGAIKQVAAA